MRNFLIKNLLITLFMVFVGFILFSYFLTGYYHFLYPVLLLTAFITNVLSFYISIKSPVAGNKVLNAVVKTFALRFFLYMGITIIYLLLEDQSKQRIVFIIILFCLYLIYSILEVTNLLKIIKSKKQDASCFHPL